MSRSPMASSWLHDHVLFWIYFEYAALRVDKSEKEQESKGAKLRKRKRERDRAKGKHCKCIWWRNVDSQLIRQKTHPQSYGSKLVFGLEYKSVPELAVGNAQFWLFVIFKEIQKQRDKQTDRAKEER